MNKMYIEKEFTFPSGLVCNCFVLTWYQKILADDTCHFAVNGYMSLEAFQSGNKPVELPTETANQTSAFEKQFLVGSGHEEKILNYMVANDTFLNGGVVKTV